MTFLLAPNDDGGITRAELQEQKNKIPLRVYECMKKGPKSLLRAFLEIHPT